MKSLIDTLSNKKTDNAYTTDCLISIHTINSPLSVIHILLSDTDKTFQFQNTTLDMVMDKEYASFDSTYGVDLLDFEKPHKHNYFELLFVANGSVEVIIEDGSYHYKKGDLCLINRNTHHHERFRNDMEVYYLCITMEFLQELPKSFQNFSRKNNILSFFRRNANDDARQNKDYMEFSLLDKTGQTYDTAITFLASVCNELQYKNPGYELFIRGYTYRLLALLENEEHYCSTYVNLGSLTEKNITYEVIHYIEKKKQMVTRSELSEVLSYNGDYISRVFKKHTGRSIKEYAQNICMEEAGKLLRKTDQNVLDIITTLGFENRTHFNHLFQKHYDMNPKKYQMKYRND